MEPCGIPVEDHCYTVYIFDLIYCQTKCSQHQSRSLLVFICQPCLLCVDSAVVSIGFSHKSKVSARKHTKTNGGALMH